MNIPLQPKVAMSKPLADHTVSGRLEPLRRQRHDKYSSGTDRAADHNHPISRKLLRECAHYRHQENNDNRVDGGKLPHRSIETEFANTELRKYIIHLQKDRFEKPDEEKKSEQSVERRLSDQPSEKVCCIHRAFSYCCSNTTPKRERGLAIARRVINYWSSVGRFRSSANKIDHGKQHDLEDQTHNKQLLKRGRFKPKQVHM